MTMTAAGLMEQAAGAFLASQGIRPDEARRIIPAEAVTWPGGDTGMERGMWRWPGASGSDHEDVGKGAFFPAATGIAPAELDLMKQAGAAFLADVLGGPA